MTAETSGNKASEAPLPCGIVRDLLPLLYAETASSEDLAGLDDHLLECDDCQEEALFLARVAEARPRPPAGLSHRIVAEVTESHRRLSREPRIRVAGWMTSVAAMLVLSLGIGLYWTGAASPDLDFVLNSFLDADEGEYDEWMVAGAPVLDALPDEVLRDLMVDME
jgi:hypothetical protein